MIMITRPFGGAGGGETRCRPWSWRRCGGVVAGGVGIVVSGGVAGDGQEDIVERGAVQTEIVEQEAVIGHDAGHGGEDVHPVAFADR